MVAISAAKCLGSITEILILISNRTLLFVLPTQDGGRQIGFTLASTVVNHSAVKGIRRHDYNKIQRVFSKFSS